MEFPDFGKQCANKDCKQLDFLPVKCDKCHALFCKDHSTFDSHQCVPVECTNDLGPKLVRNSYCMILILYNIDHDLTLKFESQ